MNNKMTHQNTLLTQTQMCPKGFDDEHFISVKSSIELKAESPQDSINAVPTKGYLGEVKLDPKGWLEKHEKFIVFYSDDA